MMKLIQLNLFITWMIMFMIFMFIITISIHPIFLMILMIFFNLSICMMISLWKSNFMYSLMIFLMMISGLLIIFMYFASLISNEQMKLFKKLFIPLIFIINLMNFFMNLIFLNKLFMNNLNYIFMESFSFNMIFKEKFINIMNLYLYPLNNFTLMSIFFILFTFIMIIKINSSSHSYMIRKIK